MRWRPVLLVVLISLLTACGTAMVNPVTGQTELSVMSEADEVAQGKKAHQQVLEEYGVYPDPKVQAYVNSLGQRLAAQSHRAQLSWHFTVLDSPEINAFALPGGYVYVTRGIMAYMESEADLAGVIGHEIGHVTARHGAQRATSERNAGLGVFAAGILGAVLETQGVYGAGRLASQVSQTVAQGYIASYGREQELQADALGAEYLARVQYDPHAMINVIKVLKDQERFAADQARAEGRTPSSQPNWLASHPSNDQRLDMISQEAVQYGTRDKYQDAGRERYLAIVKGLTFGDSAAQGLVRGPNFYHPELGIALTAPVGWKLQNAPDQLSVVNAAGDAALLLRMLPAKAGDNHADIIRNVLKPTQGRTEVVTLNGLSATRFAGVRKNAQGQPQALEVTLVAGPQGNTFALHYAAKDAAALQRNRAGMREVEASFRAITAADGEAARPWLIRTLPYPAGGFAELAKASPLASAEKQLRLINGYFGGGEPKRGQWIKTVSFP